MITRYKMEMVEGGMYDDAEWVKYSDFLELEDELTLATQKITDLEDILELHGIPKQIK